MIIIKIRTNKLSCLVLMQLVMRLSNTLWLRGRREEYLKMFICGTSETSS